MLTVTTWRKCFFNLLKIFCNKYVDLIGWCTFKFMLPLNFFSFEKYEELREKRQQERQGHLVQPFYMLSLGAKRKHAGSPAV
jgi:hypothetical protein